jgi:hypothetical protein
VGGCGLDSSWSGQGALTGPCENGNEPSDSIKGGEYFDYAIDSLSSTGLSSMELVT